MTDACECLCEEKTCENGLNYETCECYRDLEDREECPDYFHCEGDLVWSKNDCACVQKWAVEDYLPKCDMKSTFELCPANKKWNPDQCRCECTLESQCLQTQFFNERACTCSCMRMRPCGASHTWNENTCRCIPRSSCTEAE
jgi:hypothetical protein